MPTANFVRYKNWKFYYSMAQPGSTGWFQPLTNYHWTMVQNIKRDPFEQAAGIEGQKTAMGFGGALAAPSTAYLYDWNILPLGQQLREEELESYVAFPPLQAPETYNLSGISGTDQGPTLRSPKRLAV